MKIRRPHISFIPLGFYWPKNFLNILILNIGTRCLFRFWNKFDEDHFEIKFFFFWEWHFKKWWRK